MAPSVRAIVGPLLLNARLQDTGYGGVFGEDDGTVARDIPIGAPSRPRADLAAVGVVARHVCVCKRGKDGGANCVSRAGMECKGLGDGVTAVFRC